MKVDLGKVGITVSKEEWSNIVPYDRLVLVPYKGEGYLSIKQNINVIPDSNENFWMKIAIKGDKGKPFTFEDFTQEQIEDLMRPGIEAANRADEATLKANNAASDATQAAGLAYENAASAKRAAERAENAASTGELLNGKLDTLITEVDHNEQLRVEQEAQRGTNEEERVNSELNRKASENNRNVAESLRTSNETDRIAAESIRDTSEIARQTEERGRIQNESDRISAENIRKQNEVNRKSAETKRQEDTQNAINNSNAAADNAIKVSQAVDGRVTEAERKVAVVEDIMKTSILATDEVETILNVDETLVTTAIRKTPQPELTEDEKKQARQNIDAVDIKDFNTYNTSTNNRVSNLEKKSSQVYANLTAIQASKETNPNKIYIAGDTLISYLYKGGQFVSMTQPVDAELSETSTNPVQNKVISAVLVNSVSEAPNDNKPYVRINKQWKDFSNASLDSLSYGVEWDTKISDPHLLRIGNPIFHKSLPIQSQFRGCIAKGKAIQYYLNPNNWTKKEDGTPAKLDGTDGDVMIHVPKFYGKSFINGDKRQVRISLYDIDGTWSEIPEVLVSAYKVTVSDGKTRSVVNTSAEFRGGNGNRTEYDTYLNTDPFRTDLGKPRTGSSRATMRKFAEASGGELLSYELYKWIFYWCYVIEYANFNSQEAFDDTLTPEGYHRGGLGNSVTGFNSTQWSKYNGYYSLVPMGYCNSKGNFTGTVPLTIPNTVVDDVTVEEKTFEVPRWRGFDIPFGDTYTILDGIVIKRDVENEPSRVYTTIDSKCFDESIDNKRLAGIQIAKDSYIKEFDLRSTGEIIPSEVDSSSYNKNKCDYNYSNPTSLVDRGLLVGGRAYDGAVAGLAFFFSNNSVGYSPADAGFRTVYRL